MDFKTIVNTLFYNKKNWSNITNKEKEDMFFIVNRYMGKKYPALAQKLNIRNIDKATAMDIWFMFFRNINKVPDWFWKGKTKRVEPDIKDWKVACEFHEINFNDMKNLCEFFPDDVKEEIKRILKIQKETE